MQQLLLAIITGLISPAAIIIMNYFIDRKKMKDNYNKVDEQIQLNEIIDDEIDALLFDLGCDRVTLSKFHNGGYVYPNGTSMQKISIFYESVSEGTPKVMAHLQNIPCGIFTKQLAKLIKDDEIIIDDASSMLVQSYGMGDTIELKAAQTSFLAAVKSDKGKIVGVLEVDYNNKHMFTESEMKAIRSKASMISGIMLAKS